MNLSSFRTFLAFICSIGLISYVVAGPGQSGDHGRGSASGPGFNQDNNPGQQGQSASDGTKFNSQDNPGKSGSAWGRDTAEDASSNGSSHQNSNAFDRGEKMIETGDRDVGEKESAESSQGAETDKTFKASLMDTGLKASESPAAHGHAGTAPVRHAAGKTFGLGKRKAQPSSLSFRV